MAIVVGSGGTGKSWSIQHYLNKKISAKEVEKVFFWSSYYANDVLTGIDRLIEFFVDLKTPSANTQHWAKEIYNNRDNPKYDKFEFLKLILDENPNAIIVFDGIEKLLSPNKENTYGLSVNPEVKTFLKIITNKNVKSRIILTTRLFPSEIFYNIEEVIKCEDDYEKKSELLDIKKRINQRSVLSAPKCWANQLKDSNFLKVNGDYLKENVDFYSKFCSLFDGHVFAISLMKGVLEKLIPYKDATANLINNIINTPAELVVNRVIREAIINLEEDKNLKYYEKFVERISLFMHPIRKKVAKVCLEEFHPLGLAKRNANDDEEIESLDKKLDELLDKMLIKNLCQNNLVQTVEINGFPRYVVHPLVRSYIFETLHESRFSSLPGLQLPGVTSSKEVVDPGKKGKDVSWNLYIALCNESKNVSEDSEITDNHKVASDLCRAAFSIIRSRFCTNTVVRWGNYTEYIGKLLLLFDTAKRVSTKHWDFSEPTQIGFDNCCDESSPLYSDELAWVYNEIGIASFSMGDLLDASAIMGEGFEINRLIDKEFEGRYSFQSNINFGAVRLHYGKLETSMRYLNKASEIANKLENNSLVGRVVGYQALVKYLKGSLEEANEDFNNAYIVLEDNTRAKSFFMTMHGELLLKMGKTDEAIEKIEQSRHIAEADYYPDLTHYAKLARANYYVSCGEHIKAQSEFQIVLQFAKDKHLRRLETGTLSGMSKLSEKLGDYSTAIYKAVESLKISNEYSLRLHQTLSMLVLGKALVNGHQHRELGISCLKTAKSMAQKQEYFLRANEADEELMKLNER